MKHNLIVVENLEIRFYQEQDEDFISLTDIAKKFSERTGQLILNWLRTRATVSFLGAWEVLHNAHFNVLNFENIKNQTGEPTFVLTASDWIEKTGAIGIRSKTGRYGGTFAHKDIAFEFLSYLSPTFKLYVFKEFQRLKTAEAEQKQDVLEWSMKRTLAKINYHVHTEAVRRHLVPPRIAAQQHSFVYASEADLLNVALFGQTAKHWQVQNPTMKGNIRDHATTEQLLVLSNLENLNAHMIQEGFSQDERLQKLNEIAIYQMALFSDSKKTRLLKNLPG